MSKIKKVLYDGCILKLENEHKDNLNFEVEKLKWEDGSNALFHYRTWTLSFSKNTLTNPELINEKKDDCNYLYLLIYIIYIFCYIYIIFI